MKLDIYTKNDLNNIRGLINNGEYIKSEDLTLKTLRRLRSVKSLDKAWFYIRTLYVYINESKYIKALKHIEDMFKLYS